MIRMDFDSTDLQDLARAVRAEADGALLRRDLAKNLRAAVKPGVAAAKAGIMSMSTSVGRVGHGSSLRAAIARQVKAETKLGARSAGVRVKASKRGMPRGFRNAPKRTNAAKWRHPTFDTHKDGTAVWVDQVGRPGWFDLPLRAGAPIYRAAVHRAMNETADRIARRAH